MMAPHDGEPLSEEHDNNGHYIHGPKMASLKGSFLYGSYGTESQARHERRLKRSKRKKGITRSQALRQLHDAIVTGKDPKGRPSQRGRPEAGEWRPRFKPPGPKPYTAAQRDYARLVWRRARRRGEVKPPEACECCGRKVPLQAHHTDYEMPFDVMWLCTRCHKLAHGYARPPHLLDKAG